MGLAVVHYLQAVLQAAEEIVIATQQFAISVFENLGRLQLGKRLPDTRGLQVRVAAAVD